MGGCGCGCGTASSCNCPPASARSERHPPAGLCIELRGVKQSRRDAQAAATWPGVRPASRTLGHGLAEAFNDTLAPVGNRWEESGPRTPSVVRTPNPRSRASGSKGLAWRANARELCSLRRIGPGIVSELRDSHAASNRQWATAINRRTPLDWELCPCEPLPLDVNLHQGVEKLRNVCIVSLGTNWQYGQMSARVPPCYAPDTPQMDMLEMFLPWWLARLDLTDAAVDGLVGEPSLPFGGLFWPQGYFRQAVKWALRTLSGFADSLDVFPSVFADRCDTSPSELKAAIRGHNMWTIDLDPAMAYVPLGCGQDSISLRVTDGLGADAGLERGQVIASRDWGGVGLAWNGTRRVHLCSGWQAEAALADYYLWQAHRLHSWANEGDGDIWDLWMGMMCARAALSEIVELAAIILHEWSHSTAKTWGHCHSLIGRGYNCCMFGLEFVFRHFVWAKLGLAPGHLAQYETADQRRQFYSRDTPSDRDWQKTLKPASNTSCAGMTLKGEHCSRFDPDHTVKLSSGWPMDCAESSTVSVATTLGGTSSSC